MKVWKKVRFLKEDKNIDTIVKSYVNYIYSNGPLNELIDKYNIDINDVLKLNQYTANRVAGLLILYMAKDVDRLNDIANKYSSLNTLVGKITPEIEGFVEK